MKIIDKMDTILPEEEHESICIIRCSHDNVINLPKKLLDSIGWKINDKVVWSHSTAELCENLQVVHGKKEQEWVEIFTLRDIERGYYPSPGEKRLN